MKSIPFCATRASRVAVAATIASAAVAVTLIISQTGVTGAEKQDSPTFTVAGDGELVTKKPNLGDSRDPLSTEETSYAIHLASTDDTIPADATNVRGEAGPEYLYSELPDDVDSTGRKAVVVSYDYTSNRTYNQLVSLNTGTVTARSSIGLQPPPSPDEAQVAITLAINAEPALTFADQFESSEGVPLVSPEQTSYVAGAWLYDGTTVGGKKCGPDRCARLMVKTSSGTYLSTNDFVVDLSNQRIVMLGAKS